MSHDGDPNTKRRMERLRQQRLDQAAGVVPPPVEAQTYPYAAPSSRPDSSRVGRAWTWVGLAGCVVGGGVLLRALFKGTAPDANSAYRIVMQQLSEQAAGRQRMHHQQHHQHQYQSHAAREPHGAKEGSWEHRSDTSSQDHTHPLRFDLDDHASASFLSAAQLQSRAEFMQDKFHHLRGVRPHPRYQTWRGAQSSWASAASGEEHEGLAWDAFSNSASHMLHRELATQPRYVEARRLLFGNDLEPGASPLASSSRSSSTVTAGGASLPRLTCESVRCAYLTRAKECHPDVAVGASADESREAFQRLTGAYQLLLSALEPFERAQRERQAHTNADAATDTSGREPDLRHTAKQ